MDAPKISDRPITSLVTEWAGMVGKTVLSIEVTGDIGYPDHMIIRFTDGSGAVLPQGYDDETQWGDPCNFDSDYGEDLLARIYLGLENREAWLARLREQAERERSCREAEEKEMLARLFAKYGAPA